jgi:hypothetical protein
LNERPASKGEVLFARYAYPPNQLGYCGDGDGADLLEVAAGHGPGDVARRAPGFDGAWPYLQLIADIAGIPDPLDVRVVEAYWVGNDLLHTVPQPRFRSEVRRRFAAQSGADWSCLDPVGTPPPVPHHSFHVQAVYPWMGLLRRGGGSTALEILDQCRIRWGQVTDVVGDHLEVRTQSLVWDGRTLALGGTKFERPRWVSEGRSLPRVVAPGDWVSLHWDWACDTLSDLQVASLRSFTARQLAATNASGTGGPAPASAGTLSSPGRRR